MRVQFTADLNDGGNGHSETFELEELGIDPAGVSQEELDAQVTEAYNNWFNNFNMGGWGYDG